MRIVRLNKVKKKGRFVFPHNIEIQLGVHGVFRVSVSYSEDRVRVRKFHAEDEFLIEYSEKNTFIENVKIGRWKRFSGEVSVIVEEKFLKGGISDDKTKLEESLSVPGRT